MILAALAVLPHQQIAKDVSLDISYLVAAAHLAHLHVKLVLHLQLIVNLVFLP